MKVKWYGHAAFRLLADSGRSLILDPYTPETCGYRSIEDLADGCIISSDNDTFHCRADLLPGPPATVNALTLARTGGAGELAGFPIRAIEAMEAEDHYEHDPDQNGMYRIEMDGMHIGHMGDVGNPLTATQCDFFADIDVLLALAGGHPTLDLDELMDVIRAVRPPLVVPMHFRTLTYKPRNTFWLDPFLELIGEEATDFACASEIAITRADLPSTTRMLVLAHSN